jgi:hypothetical protein
MLKETGMNRLRKFVEQGPNGERSGLAAYTFGPANLPEATPEQAAQNIARQIAIDVGPESARKVVVITDEGDKVYTAPVKPGCQT